MWVFDPNHSGNGVFETAIEREEQVDVIIEQIREQPGNPLALSGAALWQVTVFHEVGACIDCDAAYISWLMTPLAVQ